jgi:4-coumarate--CoA ligase
MIIPGELIHALELSKPKLVFVSAFAAEKTTLTCRKLKFVQNVVMIGVKTIDNFAISLEDFVKKQEKVSFNVEEFTSKKVDIADQVALIMCSSGTTGMPKGVMITQKNMMSVLLSYRELFTMTRMLFDETLIVLNIAPWFHALGFMSMFMVACSRETVYVFLPKFNEETFLSSIEVKMSLID